jgi:F-type H+-transporting ATPase subunit epsilon
MGEAQVVLSDGTRRFAACIGGMLSMMNGECSLLATTWEWKEEIDEARADAAKRRAEEMIARKGLTDREYKLAEAKLKRALVRLSVKG